MFIPALIFTAVFLLWSRALVGPFQFDDYNVIVDYPPVHSLSAWWQSLPGLRPLLKLSYAINWTISPAFSDPAFGFHLFNLLVHLANGILLFLWADRVFPRAGLWRWALVLPWLLHPAQTEAVTYICGRSVALSTFFLLAGLYALTSARITAKWWAALFTLLGLATRETAWIFPFAFFLVEWLRGKDLRACLQNAGFSFIVVIVAALFFLSEPHYRELINASFTIRDLPTQLLTQIAGVFYLITNVVFGLTPNIDPDLPTQTHLTPALAAQGALLLALILSALWRVIRHRSWLFGGVLWFFLLLLPTNSFMPRLDVASDRHLYAALIGPAWMLMLLLASLQSRRFASVIVGLICITLAGATLIRNEDYRSATALWMRAAQQSPNKPRVWNNLGYACAQAGVLDCAHDAYAHAIQLDPHGSKAAVNLYWLGKDQQP